MKCAIISVGTELLMGQIVDTNAVFLSRELNTLGYDVLYRYTVGDNDGRLEQILELALNDCDMVLTTGGLGPTEDDMTKETVARFMDDVLVEYLPAKEWLLKAKERRGKTFTDNNFKQILLPSKSTVFPTQVGTAPGFCCEKDGKYVICMPGPPREMTDMFRRRIRPFLESMQDNVIYYRTLRIFGKGESLVETELLDLIDAQTDPTIATYAKMCECSVRVASKRPTLEEAANAVVDMCGKIKEILGDCVYSDEDEDLAEVVGRKLIAAGTTISCAESCTGGMFASRLTDVPGISEVFERGIVTYTERAKMEELGVTRSVLEQETAVSPTVALQMAEGLAAKTGSDICISVTGVAGPSGGTEEHPVGQYFCGCTYKGKTIVKKVETHHHERDFNRYHAVLTMFDMINRLLEGMEIRSGKDIWGNQ